MHRIACTFPPARRAAYAISMSHDQRPLVLIVIPHKLSGRTLSPSRYQLEPKTRYGASGYDLPRRDSHPLETASFAWRTQI